MRSSYDQEYADVESKSVAHKNPLHYSASASTVPDQDYVSSNHSKRIRKKKPVADQIFAHNMDTSYFIQMILTLSCIAVLVYIFIGAAGLYNIVLVDSDDTYTPGKMHLCLLGDSLINKPFHHFDLAGRINSHLTYPMNITNYGVNGNEIHDIAARTKTALADSGNPPDALILFWDSDCSNVAEFRQSDEQIAQTRAWYVANLTWVINTTLSSGVKYMAVAGPGFLKENFFLAPRHFWHKNNMLDDYRELNRQTAAQFNVTYLDVRHNMIESLAWYWQYMAWYLTVDGEHLNARGVRHVSKIFGDEINRWQESFCVGENQAYCDWPK